MRVEQGRFEDRKTTHRTGRQPREPNSSSSDAVLALARLSVHSPGFREASPIKTRSPGMPESYVPDEVREFIIRHIATVPQLEALLLIWSSPERRWGLRQVATRITPVTRKPHGLSKGFVPGDCWFTEREVLSWIRRPRTLI